MPYIYLRFLLKQFDPLSSNVSENKKDNIYMILTGLSGDTRKYIALTEIISTSSSTWSI